MYIESIGGSVGTLHEAINWTGLGLGIGLGIGPGKWNETVTRQTVTELASRSGFILSYHISVDPRIHYQNDFTGVSTRDHQGRFSDRDH